MEKALHKYLDVDVFAFLEDQMKRNTQQFQSDFEIDKNLFRRFVNSPDNADKTLLWMSRPAGTHCQREREAFIRDTYDYNTWQFYAEQTKDAIVAFVVELTGKKDGVIRGNLYELDYPAHAALIRNQAVAALDVEKTFEDGFVDRVAIDRGSFGYYSSLVDEHGPIMKSKTFPVDEERLADVLSEQKKSRDKMRIAQPSLEALIMGAKQVETAKPRSDEVVVSNDEVMR